MALTPGRARGPQRRLHLSLGITEAASQQVLLPALRCYAFWNTGDKRLAREAPSPAFHDRNLPPGRPQGPECPLVAPCGFRQAVPHLKATAEEVWVAGETVVDYLHFTGHVGDLGGQGQPTAFDATARFVHGDTSTCLNA